MSNAIKRGRSLALIFLVVLCLLSTTIPLNRIPTIPQQLRDVSGNLIVALKKPANNSEWYPFTPIPVKVEATGSAPIKSLELWVDGVKVETKESTNTIASWSWTMSSPGEHILVVRATDSAGHMANSNAIRVVGSSEPNPGMVMMISPKAGDTLTKLANQYHTTEDKLAVLNPSLASNPNASIPSDSPVKIPVTLPASTSPASAPVEPPLQSPSSQEPSSGAPNPFIFFMSGFTAKDAPPAPELQVELKNCDADLYIADHSSNEVGFNVYRLDPGQQVFKVIKTLGPNGDSSTPIHVSDPKLSGTFSYYISAINGKGEAPSNIVQVSADEQECGSPFWLGSQLASALAVPVPGAQGPQLETATFDKQYFYYSFDSASWARYPQDPESFLPAGIFDPDAQMKNLNIVKVQTQVVVYMDAWGWSGGQLTHIGLFKRVIGAPATLPEHYNASQLEICDHSSCSGDIAMFGTKDAVSESYKSWPFRWSPASALQTDGFVEVSLLPFGDTCDLNPAGLVFSQHIASAGYDHLTYFNIDFGPLKDKSAFVNGWNVSGGEFYIRVVPMLGGQIICQPSNTVSWHQADAVPVKLPTAPPLAPAPPAAYIVKLLSFSAIQYPDPAYQYCVIVKENPYYNAGYANDVNAYNRAVANSFVDGSDPNAVLWSIYAVGQVMCPAQYTSEEPSIWDKIGDWIKDAVNFVANAYNDLKAFVVDLAAKLNPLCIQANLGAQVIGKGQSTVDDVCHQIAEAAVDVALAYVGLPPSLPTYDQLVNDGKGYLEDLAVEEMGDYCPDQETCKKIVDEGFNQVIEQLKQSQNNSACLDEATAHANGFEPLCAPGGVITAPAPQGQLLPAVVTVQITRDPAVPDSAFPDPNQFPTKCNFNIGVKATNDSWVGKQVVVGLDIKTGTTPIYWDGTSISGSLFKGVSAKLPPMGLGETQTMSFALTPNSTDFPPPSSYDGFWLPGHLSNAYDWASINQLPYHDHDDWRYLYFGSTATVNLQGGCTTTGAGYSPNSTTFSDQLIQNIPASGQ